MKRDDFKLLHRLRDQRKDKAFQRVVVRQAALRHAERGLADASAAADGHARLAREREAGVLAERMGKTLSHSDVVNFRSELETLAERQAALRAVESSASDRRNSVEAELKEANATFRAHHRDAEKLGYVIRQDALKHGRGHLAVSEASDDDSRPGRAFRRPGEEWA